MRRCRCLGGCSFLVVVVFLFAGCDDDSSAPVSDSGTVTYTEGGLPVVYTEAGPVVITEAGPVVFTEAGPIPVTDGAVVPKPDAGPCVPTTCLGHAVECADCVDNDGDKLVDSQDPECLGPCDNTEGPALTSGVGGVTGSTCHVDCYFDYGNGMGNDTCWWDHQCDPLEPEAPDCTYNPKLVGNKQFCPEPQDPACAAYCLPLTPNGCDCFGCCTFPELAGKGAGGEDAFVWIGAKDANHNGMCTLALILDETKCPRCTPIPGCYNPCGKCEICMGKTTLPPECYTTPTNDAGVATGDAGVPPLLQCPGGEQPCGLPGQAPCPTGYYCISGCCIEFTLY
jgi:hypothetical protein